MENSSTLQAFTQGHVRAKVMVLAERALEYLRYSQIVIVSKRTNLGL